MNKEDVAKNFLITSLNEQYFLNGFGKTSKSVIDQILFHYFLLKELPKDLISQNSTQTTIIDYIQITKEDIYNLSFKANLTEKRCQNLIENDFNVFCTDKEINIAQILYPLIKNTKFQVEEIKQEKRIKFMINNPIVKRILYRNIDKIGGIPDFSFNTNILIINFFDFLRLLQINENLFLSSFYDTIKKEKEITELESFQKLLNTEENSSDFNSQLKNWFSKLSTNLLCPIISNVLSNIILNANKL